MVATTISLINMKGGVGKTTLAVNIAWELCRTKQVLLIDLDPQFNATQYLMDYETFDKHRQTAGTVADVLLEPNRQRMPLGKQKAKQVNIEKYIVTIEETPRGRFAFLPAELGLAKAVKNPQGVEYKLQKALSKQQKQFDYILIDCAPTDSVLTTTALMASDYILVPVKPDRFSVLGYAQIQEVLEDFRVTYPDPHEVRDLGVVFTQVKGTSHIQDQCMNEVTQQAEYIFGVQLPLSNTYERSVFEQTPLGRTRYARQNTADVIPALIAEIEDRISQLSSEE
jgi:chromosome partitioning protein